MTSPPLSTEKIDRDTREAGLTAAAQAFCNRGIEIACPWEGDLDDLEQERFDAMKAAIDAYNEVVSFTSPPVVHAAEPVAWRDETDSKHIARDMAEGRFPQRSERQKRPAIDGVWDRIRDDGELASVRSKCSMHELRRIINHAVNAHAERLSALAAASPQGDGHSVGAADVTDEMLQRAWEAFEVKTGYSKPERLRAAILAALAHLGSNAGGADER